MTKRELLEEQIKELKAQCEEIRKENFCSDNGTQKDMLTAEEWRNIWDYRYDYLISDIELAGIYPKKENIPAQMQFRVRFEDDYTLFLYINLPETL